MSVLLGPNGQPMDKYLIYNKKAAPPKLGESFGAWAGRDMELFQLPGGGLVQFDLSKLRLEDYRTMRDHYQVNSSLAVLSFMQHQSDWHIECSDKKIATFCEEQLRNNWTQLNRAFSVANWAGYSPMALNYENNVQTRSIDLNKVKDLFPEECEVQWKKVEGWAPPGRVPPKFNVYDGIKQFGAPYPIPVENSLWYPLLMEHGDYGGKKLLRPAFTSWFFSILVHLFANRYYERFGEPVPVGRAPYDEEIDVNGKSVRGNTFMLQTLQDLRSRSVVVLPNDKTEDRNGRPMFDYDIEYLESQMRGADFERYLTRLDEEISIGLFTPILLLRTADVGSYNLGVGHMQMYLWMLNAMNDDRAQYIDSYLLRKIVNFNFSEKAPAAKIKYRKMGNTNSDMIRDLMVALINKDKAKVDLEELGKLAGLSVTEVRETIADPANPAGADSQDDGENGGTGSTGGAGGSSEDGQNSDKAAPANRITLSRSTEIYAIAGEIVSRVRPQVEGAFRNKTFGPDFQLNMGFKRKFENALKDYGFAYAITVTNQFYGRMDDWINDVVALGPDGFDGPESFVMLFERVLKREIESLLGAS